MDFTSGTKVRVKNNPSIVGRATGRVIDSAGRRIVEIDAEGRGFMLFPAQVLEPVPDRRTFLEEFELGRFSGPGDLAAVVTLEKLRGELTDLIYSMGSGRTDFYPHQFKPVLKFVQANVGRILIADEVGLGKTIEAIYLWKELQVRDQARRLLVVCPSMLREKWSRELDHCFGIEARIVGAAELAESLGRAERNRATGFALIAGLEGCRPPARFHEAHGPRAELAKLLDATPATEEDGLIDLTVIDEAHYLRNPETRSNKLAGLLRDASRRMALLTATPIQLHSDNLFQLLKLVDPEDYPNPFEFDIRRKANEPIVAAAALMRHAEIDKAQAARAIDACLASPLFAKDAGLADLRRRLGEAQAFDREAQIEAARLLEERSLLGRHMTRSRKRDVLVDRVQRSPVPLRLRFAPVEGAAYQGLSKALRRQALKTWRGSMSGESLAIITRQRQMASSLPAAVANWRERGVLDEQIWEDMGGPSDDGDSESLEAADVEDPTGVSVAALEAVDTKYRAFLAAVRDELGRNPTGKIVTFAYFRPTLTYLARRLAEDGVSASLLMGGMTDQQGIIDRFAAPEGSSVLLSSEVASEGVDLQFARVLVNYDLPWNPMRLEQRIGRLDRLGQKAEKISIINLFVEDTIEERILDRLYERIGIFRESIGDLEPILGEVSDELFAAVMDPTLTDAQRQDRAEQSLNAVTERVLQTRKLEDEAQHLLGLNDFLTQQVGVRRDAGDWIRPDDLRRFIIDAFARRYPASRLEASPEDADYFHLRLCPEARVSLQAFLDVEDPAGKARAPLNAKTLFLSNPAKLKSRRTGVDLIDAGCLFMRWLRRSLDLDGLRPHAVCAARAAPGPHALAPGLYVFAVQARKLAGLRREATMETCAFQIGDDTAILGNEATLIRQSAETGTSLTPTPEEVAAAAPLAARANELLSIRAFDRAEAFQIENDRLCDQRASAARSFRDRRVVELQTTIDDVRRDPSRARITPVLLQQIRARDDELAVKLARIAQSRAVLAEMRPVALGLLLVEA
jgi:superfamily II DNA or RNA helicase